MLTRKARLMTLQRSAGCWRRCVFDNAWSWRPVPFRVANFRPVSSASDSLPPTPCRWGGNWQLGMSPPSPLAPHRPRVGGSHDCRAIATPSRLPPTRGRWGAKTGRAGPGLAGQSSPRRRRGGGGGTRTLETTLALVLLAALAGLAGMTLVSVRAAEPSKPAPRRDRAYGQMIIPLVHRDPQTPPTRTLTEAEATAVVERDWLFQAMDEPLLQRARQEIGWARDLAARLSGDTATGDLTAERRELDELAARLDKMSGESAVSATPVASVAAAGAAAPDKPSWIWFPEGDSTRDAPIEGVTSAWHSRCRLTRPCRRPRCWSPRTTNASRS